MMKYLIVSIFSFVLLVGCIKNEASKPCTPKTSESEMPVMKKFATDSSITTTQDASGLLYQIIEEGTGTAPTVNSNITIKYRLYLMNGQQVPQTNDAVTFPLGNLIEAWRIALPKIKPGGKIKIISPSRLAYGCDSRSQFANQPLYFYIELISVQ